MTADRIRTEFCDMDAVLILSETGRRFATGFNSSDGAAIITKKRACFFTDFRYIEAAKKSAAGFSVAMTGAGRAYADLINQVIEEDGIKTLGYEDAFLTVSAFKKWQEKLKAELLPMGDRLCELRREKTGEDVKLIEKASDIAEKALCDALTILKPGMTEKELCAEIIYRMYKFGADGLSFPPIVVSGKNGAMPHGTPSDKEIKTGEFVTIDIGCVCRGMCSDMTRTVAVGKVTDKMERAYETVLLAQIAGMKKIRAGESASSADLAARKIIDDAGYKGAFGHGFGHGVGIEVHELPTLSPVSKHVLKKGDVVSAEPGVYFEGEFGIRIEDLLLVTEDGYRNFNSMPKTLLVI